MMQPSTKALAQMLAGNTKISGQLVHARNVLAQANRMVDERLPDRLPPAAREQFFEQLALLKLTIADAEERPWLRRAEPSRGRPRYRWTTSACARWHFGWPRPSRLPQVPLAAASADEELDDARARQGAAATRRRRRARRRRSRRPATSPARVRAASGCASSRCSGPDSDG